MDISCIADKSDQSSIDVELPFGDPQDEHKLLCGVVAYNTDGASTKATTIVKVTPKFDKRDLEKIAESLASGDCTKSLTLVGIGEVRRFLYCMTSGTYDFRKVAIVKSNIYFHFVLLGTTRRRRYVAMLANYMIYLVGQLGLLKYHNSALLYWVIYNSVKRL